MKNLKDIGEKDIIRLLQPYIDPSEFLGTNEDAYIFNSNLPYILINIDTMSRNSDFLPGQSWAQIGSKLVSITFSDLAAKGATPSIFLSSLVLENTLTVKNIRELVKSFQKSAHEYGAKYVGGDLGSASESVLTGVGLGSIKGNNILTRHKAKPGDLVCVTGFFGLSSIGLNFLLLPTNDKFDNIPQSLINLAIKSLYEPKPRIKEGTLLSSYKIATASIDSSDGLAISLHWLSEASNVGILVNKLPIYPQLSSYLESPQSLLDVTMFGGEEYELVFTIPSDKIQQLESIFTENDCRFIVIGECISSKGVFLTHKGKKIPLQMKGWDTFRKDMY